MHYSRNKTRVEDKIMSRESWMVFQLAKSVASSVAELRARENGIRI